MHDPRTGASERAQFARELARSANRLLHFGVSHADFQHAAAAESWDACGLRLTERADTYARAAEAWAVNACWTSAAEGWRRAAVYYHYGQFKRSAARDRELGQAACRAAFLRAAAHLDPPAEMIRLAMDDGGGAAAVPACGYLRVARDGAPCVVLINGLDSAKEVELASFGDGLLRRGLSVFLLDGPGQGECRAAAPLSAFTSALARVLDRLRRHPRVGPSAPFGLWGVSFGAYLACRAAASEPRVAATVALGGFHDARVLRRLPPTALPALRAAFHLDAERDAAHLLAGEVTLAPLAGRLASPLLIVHGSADHLVDAEQIAALTAWAGAAGELRVHDGAEHVCTDRFPVCLPDAWDWLARALRRAAVDRSAAPERSVTP